MYKSSRQEIEYFIIALLEIIMLLQLYHGILRTQAYLIPEAYSKPCQIYKMMRHIGNPDMVRTVFSGISRHTQEHSATFSNGQSYLGTLRHIEVYSDITEAY